MWAARWLWLGPLVVVCVAGSHLDQGDFRTDTGRYASIGLLSARSLFSGDFAGFWTLHAPPGEVYFNKPPLAIWLHGLALAVFGVGLVAARLPVLLAAAGCCALTSAIGRETASRRVGLHAGVCLALSYEFFRRMREISLDMWQLLFLLAAVWLVARAARTGSRRLVVLAGAPIGLALLTKPLVGLVALPILAVWLVWIGRGKLAAWLAGALAVALGVAAPWHVSMGALHGDAFWDVYFGRQVVARAAGAFEREPWWYYGPILAGTAPWVVLALASVWRGAGGGPRDRGWKLAVLWGGVWLALISSFADKSPRYALLVYPMVALLSGLWLARPVWWRVGRVSRVFREWAPGGAVAVFVVLSLAPVRFNRPVDEHWQNLYAFIEARGLDNASPGGTRLYEGGMDYAKAGNVYLRFGWWPIRVEDPADVPEASLLVYHTGEHRARPGPGEEVLFESRDLIVTRLVRGPWEPMMAERIGKLERSEKR